jgi:L-ascorbate metabolism protein UlaG (beta-lactamase superfamily)
MAASLKSAPFAEPLLQRLRGAPQSQPTLYWLGQAGFVIEAAGRRILIDPYLSDSLALKYRGARFSHERLTPPPVAPEDIGAVDLILCTHHHTDHMDAATLAPLAQLWPNLRFIVPAAAQDLAQQRIGCDGSRLIAMDAGERVSPLPDVVVQATRAAHETLERDERGNHRFLGYALTLCDVVIFHSGDCVPFEGQDQEVAALNADLALLPVNGRSVALTQAGVPGNFHVAESLALCERAAIPALIAHHYGLFAFNTVEPDALDLALAKTPLKAFRAQPQFAYQLASGRGG